MRRNVAAGAASLVAVTVIALDAQAPPEALYACVNPGNSMMRLVPRTEACRANETRVQWNIAGERGPRGEQGPQGVQGVPGPKGDPGTTPDLTSILSRLAALETRVAQLEGPPPPPPPPPSAFADCKAIKTATPAAPDGIYAIDPDGQGSFNVWCDMTTDGGGWTVFQRRQDGSVEFYRDWPTYLAGFGNLSGEHWLGNQKLARLTKNALSTMRVDLRRVNGEQAFARYRDVRFFDETLNYEYGGGIFVDGNAGDSMIYTSGWAFSTFDHDVTPFGCATNFHTGWWGCPYANLNGRWGPGVQSSYLSGVNWPSFAGYFESMAFSEMKLRR